MGNMVCMCIITTVPYFVCSFKVIGSILSICFPKLKAYLHYKLVEVTYEFIECTEEQYHNYTTKGSICRNRIRLSHPLGGNSGIVTHAQETSVKFPCISFTSDMHML